MRRKKRTSNVGQTGPESIRLNGMKIGDLPMGQGNEAQVGLADFLKTYKKTKEANIRARFPQHKLPMLKAQIRECRGNIERIKEYKRKLRADIAEYRQHIKDAETRQRELDAVGPDDREAIKAINRQYLPYNVEALQQQIEQFEAGIELCDEVIEKDYESIAEIEKIVSLVEQRDRELTSMK